MADTPRSRSLTPILAQLGLIALLLVLPLIAPPDGRERASIAQFVGRFHPVLVHLPIGLLLLVPVLEIGGLLHVWRHLQKTAGFVLALATIGAIFSTAVGWLLAWSGGYEGETIMNHLWGGVWLSAACIVLTWFRHGYMAGEGYLFIRLGYMPLLFATIALMSWTPLVRGLNFSWLNQLSARERSVYFIALIGLCGSLVYYSWFQNCYLTSYQRSCDRPYEEDGRYDMGKLLAEYRGKGYVIATTEAGLLPYYSGWTAIDTWGLNDQFIAHNGSITVEYLDQYKPHIIMFHDYYSPLVPPKLTEANLAQRWFGMTILLKDYAEANGYVLASIFGDSPYDTHYYYVRADFEDSERLIGQISSMTRYFYPTTGKKSINYAGFPEP